jgi:hypothetical protein
MARRWRSSLVVVAAASAPGIAFLLVLAARRVLPDDRLWADFVLQLLTLPALPAPLTTPIASVFLVLRWHRLDGTRRALAIAACALAWIGTVQLLAAAMALERLLPE